MKKLLTIVFLLFAFGSLSAQYVVPNFTSSRPSSNNSSQSSTETKLGNIDVTFYQNGNWTYKFSSTGSFCKHVFTKNEYNRIIEDKGSKCGTYSIMEDDYGKQWIYMRYSDGRTEKGYLKYNSRNIEFHINNKFHRDDWY